ncbi:MAG: hypothetical protein ACHQNT_04360 [Bacteroidia bacterium]
MIYSNKNILAEIGENVKTRHGLSRFQGKTPNEFELVFFENGREKMVLAEGSAAFMQWTKNEMRNAPPYNHGLLSVRHKGAYKFEAIADKKHRSIRVRSPKRRHAFTLVKG